jgi:CubicO group peptidase (beta-lactamase class C family)
MRRLFEISEQGWKYTRLPAGMCCLAAILLMYCTQARPLDDTAAIPDATDRTYKDWMSKSGVMTGSLAVMKNGVIVKSFDYGDLKATRPAPIASLSKAVTAVCLAHLIDEGRLSFATPLGTALAQTFQKSGEPVDARFKTITIEQLLKHRSGLPREAARIGNLPRNMSETFSKVLLTQLEADPGTKMSYSNIGYLTLGMVVEAVARIDYEEYCRHQALEPMKATGSIDPQLRSRAPNGGWQISAIDYAKFVQAFDHGSAVLGPRSLAWLESQNGRPDYGLGTFLQHTSRGINYWHDGSVATQLGGGSYFFKAYNGWTVMVLFVRRVESAAYGDLAKRINGTILPAQAL